VLLYALCIPALAVLFAFPAVADEGKPDVRVIHAARIHTAAGETLQEGTILIRDGRIVAIGTDIDVPSGAREIRHDGVVITPGLVDACCVLRPEIPVSARGPTYAVPEPTLWEKIAEIEVHSPDEPSTPHDEVDFCPPPQPISLGDTAADAVGSNATWAEHAAEVTPHCRVIDTVNLFSKDFELLMKSGITTVYISPDSANVIGERGAVVKTAGPLEKRVVQRAAAVKVALGADPSVRGRSNTRPYHPSIVTFHTRRPTTRMGVSWVFRKSLHDAMRVRDGLPVSGADAPPAEAIPVLLELLEGTIPLRVQARMQHDIFTALRLAEEFGLHFILEEGTETYRCLPQLKAAEVPVIFGPLYMDPAGWRGTYAIRPEVRRARLNTPRQLADAGIPFALTAQEMRAEESLVRQGMVAVRNGLSADDALAAVTSTPARLIGLEEQIGVLSPGRAADLVVWNAEPFAATSRPVLVMVDGGVVYDARED
jgi:imidazolonepropionase-like amidohydrolase